MIFVKMINKTSLKVDQGIIFYFLIIQEHTFYTYIPDYVINLTVS